MTVRSRALGAIMLAPLISWLAAPSSVTARELTLHLQFHRLVVRDVLPGLASSGPYVGYTLFKPAPPFTSASGSRFVLIDDRTGKQVVLRACLPQAPGSNQGLLGGPWAAFDCGARPRFRLYNIRTHKWGRVACTGSCQRNYNYVGIARVGAKWLALSVAPHQPCGDREHNDCGNYSYLFYNIATGRQKVPRTSTSTIIDLDSPTMTRRLCRPLQVPAGFPAFPPPLTFYGAFALAQAQHGVHVDRCGSHIHVPVIPGFLVSNAQAVGDCSPHQPDQIDGIFMPSLRRFTARLASPLSCDTLAPGDLALGPRHLYLAGPNGSLWAAAFPPQPPHASNRSAG
jgi:hypothetical protein